jgi:preprotein translocase subunit YajC
MSLFINEAMAAMPSSATNQPDGMFSLVMIGAIFVLFYFMLIRPQNKRAKEQRDIVHNLKKGDEIITTGGFVAKIISLNEQFIKVNLAEGLDVNIQRSAVSTILPKGTLKSL